MGELASNPDDEPQGQWEDLQVRHQWFHVLRSAILDNKIAEIGPMAWAAYCVIKAYTNLNTGESRATHTMIASHIGASVDSVQRSIVTLVEHGMVSKEKAGRAIRYKLTESFPIERSDGTRVGSVEREYVPLGFQSVVNEIQRITKSGVLPEGQGFSLTLNVQVNNVSQGDHSVTNISASTADVEGSNLNSPPPDDNSRVVDVAAKEIRRYKLLRDV